MTDRTDSMIQEKTASDPAGAAERIPDMLADPTVPLSEKIKDANQPIITSYALMTDAFLTLAQAPVSSVYSRLINKPNKELILPTAFTELGLEKQMEEELAFSELMLLIRVYLQSDDCLCNADVLAEVALISGRLSFTEEDILTGNRLLKGEDPSVGFALRQLLSAAPHTYLCWVRDEGGGSITRDSAAEIEQRLRENPRKYYSCLTCYSGEEGLHTLGLLLQHCYETADDQLQLDCVRASGKDIREGNMIYELVVIPFAAYAERKGETPESIRKKFGLRPLEEFIIKKGS